MKDNAAKVLELLRALGVPVDHADLDQRTVTLSFEEFLAVAQQVDWA